MREWIYRRLDGALTRFKGREYRLDRAIPPGLLLALVIRRTAWLARGIVRCLVLQRRLRAVFMAPGVNLRGASLIKFGRGVTLERGVVIDALMRHGVELGANVMIGPYSVLVGAPPFNLGEGIRMGANSAVGAHSFLGSSGPITIGENVIMGQRVSFHPENHNLARTDVPIRDQGTTRDGIVVEDDVWVGANVTFLNGSYVGRGSVIGAGAVVRGEIPAWSVAVGVPAKVVKTRMPQDKGAGA